MTYLFVTLRKEPVSSLRATYSAPALMYICHRFLDYHEHVKSVECDRACSLIERIKLFSSVFKSLPKPKQKNFFFLLNFTQIKQTSFYHRCCVWCQRCLCSIVHVVSLLHSRSPQHACSENATTQQCLLFLSFVFPLISSSGVMPLSTCATVCFCSPNHW